MRRRIGAPRVTLTGILELTDYAHRLADGLSLHDETGMGLSLQDLAQFAGLGVRVTVEYDPTVDNWTTEGGSVHYAKNRPSSEFVHAAPAQSRRGVDDLPVIWTVQEKDP